MVPRNARRITALENGEDNTGLPSGLSAEQADTDRLLRQLLGTAIADRYADFCRLAYTVNPTDYNTARPHSSLGYKPPATYAGTLSTSKDVKLARAEALTAAG